jgi:hypothetical protein
MNYFFSVASVLGISVTISLPVSTSLSIVVISITTSASVMSRTVTLLGEIKEKKPNKAWVNGILFYLSGGIFSRSLIQAHHLDPLLDNLSGINFLFRPNTNNL